MRKGQGIQRNLAEPLSDLIVGIPSGDLNIRGIRLYPQVMEHYNNDPDFEGKKDKVKHILDWERKNRVLQEKKAMDLKQGSG